jgi:hypothetical protein
MAKSKSDDKADAAEVAAVRLDVETINTTVDTIQGEVTQVKSQLSRMEEAINRLEAMMLKPQQPPPPPPPPPAMGTSTTNQNKQAQVTAETSAVAEQRPPDTHRPAEQQHPEQRNSPILQRGTPVWRRLGRSDQQQVEYHDYTQQHQAQNVNYPEAYYETGGFVYTEAPHQYTQPIPQHHPQYRHPEQPPYTAPQPHFHNTTFPPQYNQPPYPAPPLHYHHNHTYQPPHPNTQNPPHQYHNTYNPPVHNPYENPQYYPPGNQMQLDNRPPNRTWRPDRGNGPDRDTQFYRSIAKPPKLDFPKFDGTNPME